MSVIKYTSLLLVLLVSVIAAQDCAISLLQEQQSTWSENGIVHSVYEVRIKNTGRTAITNIKFHADGIFDSIWELVTNDEGEYTLPATRPVIAVGDYHQFGYVAEAPVQLTIVVCEHEAEFVANDEESSVEESAESQENDGEAEAPAEQKEARYGSGSRKGGKKATKQPSTRRPTSTPTERGTKSATRTPTQRATKSPSSTSTPRATKSATAASTRRPTSSPTDRAATAAPTQKAATAAPTQKAATAAPTQKAATASPTSSSATAAPTTRPSTTGSSSATSSPASGTKICPAGTWWQPAPSTTWQWVISTTPDTSLDVQMYDIDLFSSTSATIKKLHDAGRAVICYFSTQYEDWRPDAKSFPAAALGNNLDDWEGERYVDIRNEAIKRVMQGRLDIAVSKGCDGVEPDNVDGYSSNTGFPITANDQIVYNKFLASEAHARGLSIGLKNDLSQVVALQPFFDWHLNEECYDYSECARIKPFIDNNKAVFNCEYSGSGSTVCPYMNNLKFSSLIKEHLDNTIKAQCCTYQSGGCAQKPAHKCVSY